jgi:hypothetical protein
VSHHTCWRLTEERKRAAAASALQANDAPQSEAGA